MQVLIGATALLIIYARLLLLAQLSPLHEFVKKEPRVGRDGVIALMFLQQLEQEFAQYANLAHAAPPNLDDLSSWSAAFAFVYQRHTFSSDCSGRPAAQSGRVSISRRRIAFASSARASSTSQTISSCVVMRMGMNASARLVSIRVTVWRRMSAAVACTAFSQSVPCHSFARARARRNDSSLRFSPVGL